MLSLCFSVCFYMCCFIYLSWSHLWITSYINIFFTHLNNLSRVSGSQIPIHGCSDGARTKHVFGSVCVLSIVCSLVFLYRYILFHILGMIASLNYALHLRMIYFSHKRIACRRFPAARFPFMAAEIEQEHNTTSGSKLRELVWSGGTWSEHVTSFINWLTSTYCCYQSRRPLVSAYWSGHRHLITGAQVLQLHHVAADLMLLIGSAENAPISLRPAWPRVVSTFCAPVVAHNMKSIQRTRDYAVPVQCTMYTHQKSVICCMKENPSIRNFFPASPQTLYCSIHHRRTHEWVSFLVFLPNVRCTLTKSQSSVAWEKIPQFAIFSGLTTNFILFDSP